MSVAAKAGRAPAGLTEAEARRLAAEGKANSAPPAVSRSLAEIVRSNLFTRFNLLLGSLLVVMLVVGPLQDAVFGLILIANLLIGVIQEVRAKLTLDRLAILSAAGARVVRDGAARPIPAAEVVMGDLIAVGPGDEVVVDGVLEGEGGLEVDQALLSGESAAVHKEPGEELMAGSFVVAGGGHYRATRVGADSYARRLTGEARRFQLVPSEIMRGINQILRIVTWAIPPAAALVIYSQLRVDQDLALAIRGSVAGVVTLVPEGLVLLTSAALALAILRLGRRRVLVQQLAAVEMLARCDVLCIDKTGTLTDAESRLESVEPLDRTGDWEPALAAIGRADPRPNAAARAIASRYSVDPGWELLSSVPFSSERKWSAFRFRDRGWWVLGAPDRLPSASREVHQRAEAHSRRGRRVLLLARAGSASSRSVQALSPAALVVLAEGVKPDATATLRQLLDQGLSIKVISGDHPQTVGAVARQVGLAAGTVVDATGLAPAGPALDRTAAESTVFARVSPDQKRLLVRSLKASGHRVAMLGDGVNDVLAMKEADLGIAMGSGSDATRSVAAVVLLDSAFASLPAVLAEGRRVIGNVEKLASLFFTKTVYALLLVVAVGAALLPFPFLPRQLTLVSAFTIGIPSVFLALAPSFERSREGFLGRVLRFAVPSGLVAGAATFVTYALTVGEPGIDAAEERTVAVIVISAVGLWILARLARPLTRARKTLLAAMAAGLLATFAIAPLRQLFDLDLPRPLVALAAMGSIAIALLSLEAGDWIANAGGRMLTRIRAGRRG